MKKLILLGLSFAILGGCSSHKIKENNDTVTRSGILTKIEMSSWMYGSHLLSDDTGKPLTALKKDETFEFDKYQGEKVEVTGKIIEGYPVDGGPEYLEVESIKLK